MCNPLPRTLDQTAGFMKLLPSVAYSSMKPDRLHLRPPPVRCGGLGELSSWVTMSFSLCMKWKPAYCLLSQLHSNTFPEERSIRDFPFELLSMSSY